MLIAEITQALNDQAALIQDIDQKVDALIANQGVGTQEEIDAIGNQVLANNQALAVVQTKVTPTP